MISLSYSTMHFEIYINCDPQVSCLPLIQRHIKFTALVRLEVATLSRKIGILCNKAGPCEVIIKSQVLFIV
jgi:hypothetical protein